MIGYIATINLSNYFVSNVCMLLKGLSFRGIACTQAILQNTLVADGKAISLNSVQARIIEAMGNSKLYTSMEMVSRIGTLMCVIC